MLSGTQPIVSLALAEAGLDIMLSADMTQLRAKSMQMTQAFIELIEARCDGHGLELASPREAQARGSQVSFHHEHGFEIVRALHSRGVTGDYREPGQHALRLRARLSALHGRLGRHGDPARHHGERTVA